MGTRRDVLKIVGASTVGNVTFDSRIARWAPIPLRLIVGYGFMEHGFAKLGRGPEAFADILHAIGVPGPHVMAWATILTEVIGGLGGVFGGVVGAGGLSQGGAFGVAALFLPSALPVRFHQD